MAILSAGCLTFDEKTREVVGKFVFSRLLRVKKLEKKIQNHDLAFHIATRVKITRLCDHVVPDYLAPPRKPVKMKKNKTTNLLTTLLSVIQRRSLITAETRQVQSETLKSMKSF